MKTNKKELTVFALCAYAIPFLMMPLLYICLQNGRDTSIFANAQMFYPAAGVMLAFLLARRQGTPKRFYILHIAATALMLAMSVLSAFLPQEGWLNIANFVIIIASVLGWIFLLTEKKTKREACGLRLHGKLSSASISLRSRPLWSFFRWRCRAVIAGLNIWPTGAHLHRGLWQWCLYRTSF